MHKPRINYIVDVLMAISFAITAITGLVIFFFLPSGVQRGGYQEFLGIAKIFWSQIHDYAGIILILAGIIHILLHWQWIIVMTREIFTKQKRTE